jgi:hypothetical protein
MYSIQHYVIKFASDLRQVGGFLQLHRYQPLRFFRNCYEFRVKISVTVNSLLVTDFRLLPARNRSPFKYHCDHLDASLSVKIA